MPGKRSSNPARIHQFPQRSNKGPLREPEPEFPKQKQPKPGL